MIERGSSGHAGANFSTGKGAGTMSQENSELGLKLLQKVARENISYVGGAAAILLQIAHPLVGKGVSEHSQFATRTISRTQYTQMYIYAMIFGTPDEKAAMQAFVNKAHSRVKGGEGESSYNAQDPELQLWVAITIYVSMINGYESMHGPLPPSEAELVYQAFSVMGTALQVPPDMWPPDLASFKLYWNDMVENRLQVSSGVRGVMNDLFHPQGLPLLARPVVALLIPLLFRPMAVEQLPPNVREQYGLESTWATRALSNMFMSTVEATYPLTPRFIRQSQKTYYMNLMRKRIARRGGQLVKP
ncbi:hypothetical protein FQN54_005421 [Arachnomyces sp. PD_36]|nr:hypothetical protein FQN54_005421 [Arachnomyces sp. PD_36]